MHVYAHQGKARQDGMRTYPLSFRMCRGAGAGVVPDADENVLKLIFMNGDSIRCQYGSRYAAVKVNALYDIIARKGYDAGRYRLMGFGGRLLSDCCNCGAAGQLRGSGSGSTYSECHA